MIPFTYNDAENTLTIGDRKGEFPGMLKNRKFNIVKVSKENPRGYNRDTKGILVNYDGAKQVVKL